LQDPLDLLLEPRVLLAHEIANSEAAIDGGRVLLLLHGRGADRHDLLGLSKRLPADWVLVAPEAPFPAAPWGYGPGWAWYRFLGGNRPEPESFSQSLDQLHEFIAALPKTLGIEPRTIAVGGFSQGGTLSMACALDRPAVPLVLNFSGFLADHPRVRATTETVQGTRFFWGHGTGDPNIPFTLAREGRAQLLAAGAQLEARDYPIGHWIDPTELADANVWLAAQAP
jgi:phospholipase/carboxylesterase